MHIKRSKGTKAKLKHMFLTFKMPCGFFTFCIGMIKIKKTGLFSNSCKHISNPQSKRLKCKCHKIYQETFWYFVTLTYEVRVTLPTLRPLSFVLNCSVCSFLFFYLSQSLASFIIITIIYPGIKLPSLQFPDSASQH